MYASCPHWEGRIFELASEIKKLLRKEYIPTYKLSLYANNTNISICGHIEIEVDRRKKDELKVNFRALMCVQTTNLALDMSFTNLRICV